MFEQLQPAPPDPILGLTEAYKEDPNPDKINLGVGIFQNEEGNTPVLDCVKQAETRLLESETNKKYAPINGEPAYGRVVRKLLFGAGHKRVDDGTAVTCHAPGGTGALRIGADFIAENLPDAALWLSDPTWANHKGVFGSAGLTLKSYAYYDAERKGLDLEALLADLSEVPAGDVVVLHVACHNPTGQDPTPAQWEQIADVAVEKGWLPFFDFAYQGFGEGLEPDRAAVECFERKGLELLIASSFSKNFSLYGERVGALTLAAESAQTASTALSLFKRAIRVHYSNPPVHGGRIVTTVLEDEDLTARWIEELAVMRNRISEMRMDFAQAMREKTDAVDFGFLTGQYGMFSFSGLTAEQVDFLREEYSIYIVRSGRINVAGIRPGNLDYLTTAVTRALEMD